MFFPMPWFAPLGLSIGLFGTHTAVQEKRLHGGHWRIDAILLTGLAWVPMMLWVFCCFYVPAE